MAAQLWFEPDRAANPVVRVDGLNFAYGEGDARNQVLFDADSGRNVHSRGKGIIRRLRHIDVIIGMNRRVAAKRRAGKLAASIRNHLVDVHIELRAAARHPDMQRKHVVMLTGEDFVAGLDDQFVSGVVHPTARMIGERGALLQDRVARDHLARDQILADAEMLQRALRLCSPQLVGGHFHDAEAVGLFPELSHLLVPFMVVSEMAFGFISGPEVALRLI